MKRFNVRRCNVVLIAQVEFAEAEDLCNYIPEILFCMETSAKENTNIEDAFTCLATELKVRKLPHTNVIAFPKLNNQFPMIRL